MRPSRPPLIPSSFGLPPPRRVPTLLLLGLAGLVLSCTGDGPTALSDENSLFLTVVSGDGQYWVAGYELPEPLVVLVTTQGKGGKDQPAPGRIVNFRVLDGGGSVFAGAAITNDDGIAREYWTLGQEPGENTLEVRAVNMDTGEKEVYGRFTAQGKPWPGELTAVRALAEDAWVRAVAQRLDPLTAGKVLIELDRILAALGEALDLQTVDNAITKAKRLVENGEPPYTVEFTFLDLVVARSRTLFDAAVQSIQSGP